MDTVTLIDLGIHSNQDLVVMLLQAAAVSQHLSSAHALQIPCVVLRRFCVRCAHDTWGPTLCSLDLLPAKDNDAHPLLGTAQSKPPKKEVNAPLDILIHLVVSPVCVAAASTDEPDLSGLGSGSVLALCRHAPT